MGLATSQVRLLSLTSRKADVELQIQLNSKRKTLLTRKSSALSQLYYAKLQNSKIQYATGSGYKDINYQYLMYNSTSAAFDNIAFAKKDDNRKVLDTMILTDNFGRVILDSNLAQIVCNVMNMQTIDSSTRAPRVNPHENYNLKYLIKEGTEGSGAFVSSGAEYNSRTVETMVLDAIAELLNNSTIVSGSSSINGIKSVFNNLYFGTSATNPYLDNSVSSVQKARDGVEILKSLLNSGGEHGGVVYVPEGYTKPNDATKFYTGTCRDEINPTIICVDPATETTLKEGCFYIVKTPSGPISDQEGELYKNGKFLSVTDTGKYGQLKYLSRIMQYYGAIFAAAFNGTQEIEGGNKFGNLNAAVDFEIKDGKYNVKENAAYNCVSNTDKLQAGLRSGLYQLVNVSSYKYGDYSKGQGIDYFKAQNYIVEKIDNDQREQINAWFQAEKASLADKESEWDTEVTRLSTELATINAEIESVKKLRDDAIGATFKWGSA